MPEPDTSSRSGQPPTSARIDSCAAPGDMPPDRYGDCTQEGETMTLTAERRRMRSSGLQVEKLSLHRETLQELTGNRARDYGTGSESCNGCSLGCTFVVTCFSCRHCTHKC